MVKKRFGGRRNREIISGIIFGIIIGTVLRLLTSASTGWLIVSLIGAAIGILSLILAVLVGPLGQKPFRSSEASSLDMIKFFVSPVGILAILMMGLPYWLFGLLVALGTHLLDLLTQGYITSNLGWILSGAVWGAFLGAIIPVVVAHLLPSSPHHKP